MELPPLDNPGGYVGLFVIDFGETCSVGYTAEEVARLLDSEAYADAQVYRIHSAAPDGTMELRGLSRKRFELESGMMFYRRDLPAARADYESLRELAGSRRPPCRAKLFLAELPQAKQYGFAVGLAFPAECDEDIARWLSDSKVTAGENVAGGIALLDEVRSAGRTIESCQLDPATAHQARPLEELIAAAGQPVQRIA